MKKFIMILAMSLVTLTMTAQVYDGITQPTRYRLWMPVSTSTKGGNSTSAAPFVGIKLDVSKWLSLTSVTQYNMSTEHFIPQIWVNVNYKQRFYLLSRNIYDAKDELYKQTLSTTAKLPYNLMVDATWFNMYNGKKFCDGDRLQVLGGYAYKWFVVNAGYSMRTSPGFVSNIRFKVTPYDWLQLRYDGGSNTFDINFALQFN
jgi:hypothetical protein